MLPGMVLYCRHHGILGLLNELCFHEQLSFRRRTKLSNQPRVVTVKSCTGACQAFHWSCCPRCCCSGWTPRCPRSPRSPAPPAVAASRTGSPYSSTCALGLRLHFSSPLVEDSSQLQSLRRRLVMRMGTLIGLAYIHWLLAAFASSCPQRQLKKAWVPLLLQCTGISHPPLLAPVATPPSEERRKKKLPLPPSPPGRSPFQPRTAQQTASACPSPPCSPPGKVLTSQNWHLKQF